VTRLAFYFDASACSGCKACQIACKDKQSSPLGVRWRRVYEVAGGGWHQRGAAWVHDVFAYHLSVACNHCERPICVEVCPTRAITQRDDGVVLLDAERCMGCRYCEWACPYGAPQYDVDSGRMSKCDFCVDELDAGRPPACVAACPMRALDFGDMAELASRYGTAAVYPLPDHELTRPAFYVTPPGGAEPAVPAASVRVLSLTEEAEDAADPMESGADRVISSGDRGPRVANREEVRR
jgi:anaerobic dimethyl sulfoxide reductase subunit B (iron-sulfur subunit)